MYDFDVYDNESGDILIYGAGFDSAEAARLQGEIESEAEGLKNYYIEVTCCIEPLSEEDYIELRHRFGSYVEFVVRDMISGEGERWSK